MANQAEKIRSINTPGWDGVNSTADTVRLNNISEQQAMDLIYKRCFSTEAGQEVLKHLISITVDQPAWIPGADSSYGFSREGQNSIVREIQQRIRRTENAK